ncbi:TonB C-terminal domain-containing protein [Sphingomonas spermidinifaciens]|nr:TonB C-terminal domain-containing protein [Sphingomonas spermidinifaciens]
MFAKASQNVRQPILSLLGAVAASTLALGLAVAPARATGDERREWTARVSGSLQNQVRDVPSVPAAIRTQKAAIVAAHFDREGRLYATSLDVPTGNRILDDEALRAVNATAFPPMPASMRGRVRVVPVEVFFSTPGANRARPQVRRTALDLAARIQKFHAEVPAGQPQG